MKVGIIDADLLGRKNHRFPNLASMKISSFHKMQGDDVSLLMDYDSVSVCDKVYLSKVFTDTAVPDFVLKAENVQYGGTGFYYDKAPKLPQEIEHIMPDYHLYDDWLASHIADGMRGGCEKYKFYTDYSIGFVTRGCFRRCEFCVNRNYTKAELHSPLEEFVDPTRKKICLLDDNVLSHPDWKRIFAELNATGKRFQFKQGMDERLLTDEKCEVLFSSKYDGEYIFAFDNIADYDLIKAKLGLIRKHTDKTCKFYCFCGFDRTDKWTDFWYQDIIDVFRRIELLMQYKCIPYIMRFNRYVESPFSGVYIDLARWCNQPSFFKKKSFREFCGMQGSSERHLAQFLRDTDFERDYCRYLDMKFSDF